MIMGKLQFTTNTIKAQLSVDGAGTAAMDFVRLPKVGDEVVYRRDGKSSHVRVTGFRRDLTGPSAGTFIIEAKAA